MVTIFAIYDHPVDYPDCYVVRQTEVTFCEPDPDAKTRVVRKPVRAENLGAWPVDNIEEARDLVERIQPGLARFGREDRDDPSLVEVWL